MNAATTCFAVTPAAGTGRSTVIVDWGRQGRSRPGLGWGPASMIVRWMVRTAVVALPRASGGAVETPVTCVSVTTANPGGVLQVEVGLTRMHAPHGPPAASGGPNSIT